MTVVEGSHRKVSALKKPAASAGLEKILAQIEIIASAQGDACPIDLPSKDRPIFLSALKAKATHLLTGDLKDFGAHMNKPEASAGIIIQTVADFFADLK